MLGLFVGALVGLILFMIIAFVVCNATPFDVHRAVVWIAALVIIGVCAFSGVQIEQTIYSANTDAYIVTKSNFENAMRNADISDLEKINLVDNIAAYNNALAQAKRSATKWWGFAYDKRVLELEYISIDSEGAK